MAEVTPTGQMGIAMVALRDMIADSATFQAAVGAADAEAAKAFLHLTAYDMPDGGFVRPFGLISQTENNTATLSGNNAFTTGGQLELRLEKDIAADYADEPGNAELDFLNFVDGVMADCKARSGTSGYLIINALEIIEGPAQIETAANEYVYAVRLGVSWGLQ